MTIPVRRLRVFEKAVDFAVRVNVLTRKLPFDWQHLAHQARRSSCSIALNLSEGCSQQGAEQRRYFRISRGSVWECDTTIHILARAGALPTEAAKEIEEAANVISAMITALITRSERTETGWKLQKKKEKKKAPPKNEPNEPSNVIGQQKTTQKNGVRRSKLNSEPRTPNVRTP